MITAKMTTALNGQINKEMYSAFLYLSMSAESNDKGLKGFANWFTVQYHEEMFHAMKLYEYIARQGGTVELEAIKKPGSNFSSPIDMLKKTLAHEQYITMSINKLMDLAVKEKDHATQIFLQWYVSEQIEEEENDQDIINQLKLIGKDASALLMLDKQLAGRTTTVLTDYSKGVEAGAKELGSA